MVAALDDLQTCPQHGVVQGGGDLADAAPHSGHQLAVVNDRRFLEAEAGFGFFDYRRVIEDIPRRQNPVVDGFGCGNNVVQPAFAAGQDGGGELADFALNALSGEGIVGCLGADFREGHRNDGFGCLLLRHQPAPHGTPVRSQQTIQQLLLVHPVDRNVRNDFHPVLVGNHTFGRGGLFGVEIRPGLLQEAGISPFII
ncbi:hypothetical protein D3C75_735250 [compost metagenome]